MEHKNLPIKIFQKRKKIDERKTEGMGDDYLPDWALLTPQQTSARRTNFKSTLDTISNKLKKRPSDRDFIPALIEVEIHEKATAKSHRADISSLFDVNNNRNLIGYTNERNLLIKINSEKDIVEINRRISNDRNIKGLGSVTELVEFKPTVAVEKVNTKDSLRVSLVNFHDIHLNKSVCTAFEKLCRINEVEFKKVNYSPNLIVYRLSKVTTDRIENIKEFEAVETIAFMPVYGVTLDEISTDKHTIEIRTPEPGKKYPVVGILDTGIEDIPHLKPWILKERFSKIPEGLKDKAHGTFVAGIVAYGDDLQSTQYIGHDGCYLFDAAIHPGKNDTIEESDLVEHIREAIRQNYDHVKVWNLSLGTKNEAEINEFSFFGKSLDQIQDEYGVIICKSAGNCMNFVSGRPVARIAQSADSVRSLVVGAIAHQKGPYDIAEINHRSPFSRIGKAPGHINKPDLTHIGGNAGVDPAGKIVQTGVRSFMIDGKTGSNVGTSFSTPRVSSLVATIENRVTEDYDPLLLKALSVHSAKYPGALNLQNSEKLNSMGYGVPSTTDDILYNDPHEITLILQDKLIRGNWIEIPDFPFPQEMVEDGSYYGEIIVTLVASPLLSESQGAEYCQSNLDIRLGTYENMKKRAGKTIRNDWGLNESENFLKDGLYAAKFRNNHVGEFARERVLIKYGNKYQPIKKYAINLNEMTPTNRVNFLTAPKKWFLQIEGIYREHITLQADTDSEELSQDFCLIVTIRDSKKKYKVYDLATKMLNDNGFVHSNISISQDLRLTVGI